eukprot:CFRG8184T1
MMRGILILILVLASAILGLTDKPNTSLQLMPYPRLVELKGGAGLQLDRNFSAKLTGVSSPRLFSAIERLYARIERQTGFFLTTPVQCLCKTPQLIIDVKSKAPTVARQADEDDSYKLEVNAEQATLVSNTPYGALYGLETFLQLVQITPADAEIPAIFIEDSPRFKWRGVLIDSVRHFVSIDLIKRQINGLVSAKLNTLHWHLTDDQGWRIESKTYPNLHEKGSDGLYYTQYLIKHVVDYARNLGIRIVPEIDIPGHASAIAVAYPALIADVRDDYVLERKWGVHEPLLDPSNPDVYVFIDSLIGEIVEMFPDEFIHIGGDEVYPKQWDESERVQTFMKDNSLKDNVALHAYFNQRVATILAKYGRKMVGWDEIYQPDLSRSVVIQSWRGHDALSNAAKNGYKGILSTGYYIDQPHDASMHYRNDPIPKPLQVDDHVKTDETWETWSFEAKRIYGSNITGTFTFIHSTGDDPKTRGFIDFKGRSRRSVFDITNYHGITSFWMDSWMGYTRPRVYLVNGSLSGDMVVGNIPYVTSGEKIAGSDMPDSEFPTTDYPVVLSQTEESLILGGEITLWGEIVKEDNFDLRMWPRSYVIAERLWSSGSLTDEDSMYERMQSIGNWATISVGLQHEWNAYVGLQRLGNAMNIRPVRVLAQAVEQAQYYNRHHQKHVYENYDQFDPLNRLADALPPESIEVRELGKKIDEFIADPSNLYVRRALTELLQSWVDNTDDVMQLLDNNYRLKAIKLVAQHVHDVSKLGLKLVNVKGSKESLLDKDIATAKALLNSAQQIQDELVVAIAYPIEHLLLAVY